MNYSRQILKYLRSVPHNPTDWIQQAIERAIWMAENSIKFSLPPMGRVHDDKEFRGLDESEELHLPFPTIALEYERNYKEGSIDGHLSATKVAIFLHDYDEYNIEMLPVNFIADHQIWAPVPPIFIPKTNYINRNINKIDGRVPIGFFANKYIPASDYSDEAGAFLNFLNILQCNNVEIQKVACRPLKKSLKRKGSIPFDEYRILTILTNTKSSESIDVHNPGIHRSPREHIRRGHIRRLDNNRKVWVNSAVVNSGNIGKIHKDYRIQPC